MILTGTASATTLTAPYEPVYTGTIKASSEGAITVHNPALGVSAACQSSTLEGKVEQHGSGVAAGGKLSSFTLSECGTDEVNVLARGSLEIHATEGGNGTVTWTGASITITHSTVGVSCIYKTEGTDIGTLTGSTTTNATLDLNSSTIPRAGDSIFCGSKGTLTGSYKITMPSTLVVD
ncbi:MAG TPA: hypothetical protein VFT79_05395 [Solirubrobacterales bacterium]|nr:hypothetical protein [Solirubrobacterales bacterium]